MEAFLDLLRAFVPALQGLVPVLLTITFAIVALLIIRAILRVRERRIGVSFPFSHQIAMLTITALAVVAIVLTLPVEATVRGQLLSLLGIVLTGMIAFASTTFVANAMAGLMLRAVSNFRGGDWIRVGDQFGRVTERGLFHTELQTEDRDLTTLPNLYLVTNPVVVVRASGTIVSAQLSLGYDCNRAEIETLLIEAGLAANLEDPFVQILELGDFSITYRIAGFLSEVQHLLTVRSRLRGQVLDSLHRAGVEIVSPNFVNQRQLDTTSILPQQSSAIPIADEAPPPEERIFDKANLQASVEALNTERDGLLQTIADLNKERPKALHGRQQRIDSEVERIQARIEEIVQTLAEQPQVDEP